MRIKGTFKEIVKKESGTSKAGKEWEKILFILDTGSDYNSEICISAFGDKIELVQNLKEETEIECQVNISSKEYNGRWYHNIAVWDIDIIDSNNDMPF